MTTTAEVNIRQQLPSDTNSLLPWLDTYIKIMQSDQCLSLIIQWGRHKRPDYSHPDVTLKNNRYVRRGLERQGTAWVWSFHDKHPRQSLGEPSEYTWPCLSNPPAPESEFGETQLQEGSRKYLVLTWWSVLKGRKDEGNKADQWAKRPRRSSRNLEWRQCLELRQVSVTLLGMFRDPW